jgi:hypothetical protein
VKTKPHVLYDLNIVLDVLQHRERHYEESARALTLADNGLVGGLIAARSLTPLHYLYARWASARLARGELIELLRFLSVATVDQQVIEQALSFPYGDFEDAVQMRAAGRAGADYLVTRNVRDFSAGPLPAVQPVELLAILLR